MPSEINSSDPCLLFSAVMCLLLFGAHECPGGQDHPRLVIMDDGKVAATIVIAPGAPDEVKQAAQLLRHYLWRIGSRDGQQAEKLPIRVAGDTVEGARLFVGRSGPVQEIGFCFDGLGAGGFRIQTADGALVLCGQDDLGTAYAVYTFLEKYCGVRWLWPGELGEHVPHRRTLSIGKIRDVESPDFKLRLVGKDQRWRKRNKLAGGMKFVGGHNWGKMVPPKKYGPQHPEYFALVKGTRDRNWNGYDGQHGYQLCTTNPQVIKISVDYVRAFFNKHPDVDMYSVSPNDGLGWCQCDRCRALDTGKLMADGRKILADRIFTFTNQLAREIKKTHPGKYLVQFAYQNYIEPPETVQLLDNVVVMITVNCEGNYAVKHKANHWRLLRKWSQITPNVFLYEYFTHTWKPQLPRAMPRVIGQAMRFYKQCGVPLFYAQSMNDFAGEGLDYYIVAKLLWDADQNVDEIVDDYCQKAFGNAAGVMKQYFYRLEELWSAAMRTEDYWHHGSGQNAGNPDDYLAMFTPQSMAELEGYLTKALRLAQPGEFQQRVQFMLRGWRYTKREVSAFRAFRSLADKGIINYRKGASSWRHVKVADLSSLDIPKHEAKRLIARTIAAWEERDRNVEELSWTAPLSRR